MPSDKIGPSAMPAFPMFWPSRCLFLLLLTTVPLSAKPVKLRCDSLQNPLGIDSAKPSLSWQSDSLERGWKQSSYQILVSTDAARLQHGTSDVWDSGRIVSGDSVGIPYDGPALVSRQRYFWAVRTWDAKGHRSQSMEEAWWEMGLLDRSDWHAQWIAWLNPQESADEAGIRWIWPKGQDALHVPPKTKAGFRLVFTLTSQPERAALFLIARGDWQVTVNGNDAGSKPHWGEFDRRDIGPFLRMGSNVVEIAVDVPPGGGIGLPSGPPDQPRPAALAALVKITNSDGSIQRLPTDNQWQARLANTAQWSDAQAVADLGDPRLGPNPLPLPQPAAMLRREFTVGKQVKSARVYVTALGSYKLFLNGEPVSCDVLTPGFTDFSKRVQYQTYDITALLKNGGNAVGALLGGGWFRSGMSWTAEHFPVPPPARGLVQIEIAYGDGTHDSIVSDATWKAAESPILHSEIYAGEMYDARLEQPGWNQPGFNDSQWTSVPRCGDYDGLLSSQIDSPPQVVMTLKPQRMNTLPGGTYVYDMGQNMVGWAALKVNGKAGSTVRLRFAEILNPDGSIYTKNLRNADATDRYTLRGGMEETFAPTFTFHGFRYVEVAGYPGTPTLSSISGQVVSSLNQAPTGHITTSSDLVNRMWDLGIWGQRGNFLSIPTDCPQRDERLGWMADAAVFWRTGSYNFDIASFTYKWLRDVADAQSKDGAFSNVAPSIGVGTIEGAPGWGDAGVIVPWTTWMQYGDLKVVREHWESMKRWMAFIEDANPDFIRRHKVGPDFADWLAPDPTTPKDLVDTAYWALIARMMTEMAEKTGNAADAKQYAEVYTHIREAFQKAYIKADGTIGTGSQTSYIVALQMGLAPASLEAPAVNHLVKNIEQHNWHLTTGFLGTPFLLFTLADHGQTDLAYRLLLTETYPSWGYMVKKGATTWWERWNGDTGDPAMNSYNHYAFGSVMAWVYRCVTGIDTDLNGPGFHQILIHPRPSARLTSARGEYDSVYGKIKTDWSGTPSGPFSLKVTIPANTTAKVYLPGISGTEIIENGKPVTASAEAGERVVEIGSGSYSFQLR